MKELREIISLWQKHHPRACALATLVRARGSSYRRPGARMLITSSGETAGALSAGCIEEEVAMHARDVIASGEPKLIAFDTRRRFGCSGSIEIFIELLDEQMMEQLRDVIAGRRACTLVTLFEDSERLGSRISRDAAFENGFAQTIEPPLRLIVIGEGPDASALVAHAQLLDWDLELIRAITELRTAVGHRTAAVIATHNFGRDCAALRHLLPLGLRYVGLVGPRRRREELLLDVIDSGAATKSELFAPAGLHLAAETPEEIALSIIAEIQAVFADGTGKHLHDRKEPIHANNSAELAMPAR